MILKRHHISIWLRTMGILANCFAVTYFSLVVTDWLLAVNLSAVLVIQVFLLVRFQNAINRDLEFFFDTLKSSDPTTRFTPTNKSTDIINLYKRFDEIIELHKSLRIEKEQQSQYFSALIEHISIGIISVNANGKVLIANSAAKRLLGYSNLQTINDFEEIDGSLKSAIDTISPNEQRLVSLYRSGRLLQLSMRASQLKIQQDEIKILSFQNIKNELDESEMEGWQKLIRVLTHELMNSVGPINSTISTLLELLSDDDEHPKTIENITVDEISDTFQGLRIVEERTKGMVDFVTRFRNLTLIPQPKLSKCSLNELFKNIQVLLHEEAVRVGVELCFSSAGGDISVEADKGMLEQIFINLIKNAMEAAKDKPNPKVSITAWTDNSQNVYIDFTDNGKGIPIEIQNKIFVPFFTTRKDGTGIGLSLSRQLANIQGGVLALTKSTIKETVFTLKVKGVL